MKSFTIDKLQVEIKENTEEVGKSAAHFVAGHLQKSIMEKGSANLILATGASQFSFLDTLKDEDIAWKKITVFHLDEYKDLSEEHPASFRKYLKERILNEVQPKKIFFLNGDVENLQVEMQTYEYQLKKHPIDIACIGIGENGHIAFNDPPIADFNDPTWVKIAELDEACRQQQLGEGWFDTLEDVPKQALTLTIPAIMSCKTISCVVPDARKAEAVHATLYKEISTQCPASILRTHPNTRLFLDRESAQNITPKL